MEVFLCSGPIIDLHLSVESGARAAPQGFDPATLGSQHMQRETLITCTKKQSMSYALFVSPHFLKKEKPRGLNKDIMG